MEMNYNKLWKMLIDRHMTKTEMRLAVGLSTVTLARMNKGEKIRSGTLRRICEFLKCSPNDVVDVAKSRKSLPGGENEHS